MLIGISISIPTTKTPVAAPSVPTGNGTLDFSNADDSGLLALLEDI